MNFRPRLNNEQLKVVSGIFVNLGNISIASIALPFFVPTVSRGALSAFLAGMVFSILFWWWSVEVVKDLD